MNAVSFMASTSSRCEPRRRAVLIVFAMLHSGCSWKFYDSDSCWEGQQPGTRERCCGPPQQPDCFDSLYTVEQCCTSPDTDKSGATAQSCLPLEALTLQTVLLLSAGLETSRLSTGARPVACDGIGWQSWYVLLRIGAIGQTQIYANSRQSPVVDAVLRSDEREARLLRIKVPLRSILICAPPQCSEASNDIAKLALYVAERTLPAPMRPLTGSAWGFRSAEVLSAATLGSLVERIGAESAQKDAAAADLNGVLCHSGACDAVHSAFTTLPRNAVLLVDVGTAQGSEFLERLGDSDDPRLWVVGFEPNPNFTAVHAAHPRLALLEAAVGHPDHSGFAALHLSKAPCCSSLLPLSATSRATHVGAGRNVRRLIQDCLTPASEHDAAALMVRVVPLAALLRLLPEQQQVALLKLDAQGGDLAAIISAGPELRRVRWLQVEVHDFPKTGDERLPYTGQPSKWDVISELALRGFVLDACRESHPEYHEEDCLFVRSDILAQEARLGAEDVVHGQLRWDRPAQPGH